MKRLKTSFRDKYTFDKPLAYYDDVEVIDSISRGFILDKEKGTLDFAPIKVEKAMFRMQITEWRAQQIISIVEKDIFCYSNNHVPNSPPIVSGFNCRPPYPAYFSSDVLVGEKLGFAFCTSSLDDDAIVTLSWNSGIPDASFRVQNKGDLRESAEFCWTPSLKDTSNVPHTFTVTATSVNSCGETKTDTRTYSIMVSDFPSFDYNFTYNECGQATLKLNRTSFSWIYGYQIWINNQIVKYNEGEDKPITSIIKHLAPGTHKMKIMASGSPCHGMQELTITIPEENPSPTLTGYRYYNYCENQKDFKVDVSDLIHSDATVKWLDNNSTQTTRTWEAISENKNYYIEAQLNKCIDTFIIYTKMVEFFPENISYQRTNESSNEVTLIYPENDEAQKVTWFLGDPDSTVKEGKRIIFTYPKQDFLYHTCIS